MRARVVQRRRAVEVGEVNAALLRQREQRQGIRLHRRALIGPVLAVLENRLRRDWSPRRLPVEWRACNVVHRDAAARVAHVVRDCWRRAELEQSRNERCKATRRREAQRGRAGRGLLSRDRVDRAEVGVLLEALSLAALLCGGGGCATIAIVVSVRVRIAALALVDVELGVVKHIISS